MRIAYGLAPLMITINYALGAGNPRLLVILDSSFSMSNLGFSKSIKYIKDNMECQEPREVCIVTFATQAKEIVQCTKDMNVVKNILPGLKPYNQSSIYAKTNIANVMTFAFNKSLENTMVLFFSDGKPTLPGTTRNAKKQAIKAAVDVKNTALSFYCIGMGDSNNHILRQMCGGKNVFNIKNLPGKSLCPKPEIAKYPRLVILLDRSYSITLKSFLNVIDYLNNNMACNGRREVCLIVFATQTKEVAVCTNDINVIKNVISTLKPYSVSNEYSGTNLAKALTFIKDTLSVSAISDTMVVLFSDGKINLPININHAKKLAIDAANEVKNKTLLFNCVGMGNADNNFLRKICDKDKIYHVNNTTKINLCPNI